MTRIGRPPMTPTQIRAGVISRIQQGEGCWTWSGHHRKKDGRPYFMRRPAYRVVWEVLVGPLTEHEVLHHVCENKACVRPSEGHVQKLASQGTHALEHGQGGDWGQAQKTHCPAGHAYDEENTYTVERVRDGQRAIERHCKVCRRAAKARYRAKKD